MLEQVSVFVCVCVYSFIKVRNVHKRSLAVWFQFLATLKIMDYSLLVGIHDVDRAEQEEMDVEGVGEEDEYENDGMGGGVLTGSFGTPPDSPGNPLNCGGFFGPGEFDSSVDVYAIKSHDGEEPLDPRPPRPRAAAVSNGAKRAVFAPGAVKKEVYFMAIIDILTHYDAKKKAAHAAKTVKHGVSTQHNPPPRHIFLGFTSCSPHVVASSGRSGDLDGEPRAVLQAILRVHVQHLIIDSPLSPARCFHNPGTYFTHTHPLPPATTAPV